MPVCPKCGTPFREGFSKCSDCHVDLIDDVEVNANGNYESQIEMKLSYLMNVLEEYELANIESLLKSNGIPLIKKTKGSGEYMKIRTGLSFYGYDLYVPEESLIEAKDIINTFYNNEAPNSLEEEATSEEIDYAIKRRRKIRILLLLFCSPGIIAALAIILNTIFKKFF